MIRRLVVRMVGEHGKLISTRIHRGKRMAVRGVPRGRKRVITIMGGVRESRRLKNQNHRNSVWSKGGREKEKKYNENGRRRGLVKNHTSGSSGVTIEKKGRGESKTVWGSASRSWGRNQLRTLIKIRRTKRVKHRRRKKESSLNKSRRGKRGLVNQLQTIIIANPTH